MDNVWAMLVGWAGAWFLTFLVFEMYALVSGKETLSEWIRARLGIEPITPVHTWAAPLFAFIIFGFAVWFVPHIEGWINW